MDTTNNVIRYRTTTWQRVRCNDDHDHPGFAKHLREVSRGAQIAFQRLMHAYQGQPIGVECKSLTRDSWAFVSPEVSDEEYEWRVQNFDQDGFVGHFCYRSLHEAIEGMINDGYREIDPGALDRLAKTDRWAMGTQRSIIRTLFNRGLITWQEMLDRFSLINP